MFLPLPVYSLFPQQTNTFKIFKAELTHISAVTFHVITCTVQECIKISKSPTEMVQPFHICHLPVFFLKLMLTTVETSTTNRNTPLRRLFFNLIPTIKYHCTYTAFWKLSWALIICWWERRADGIFRGMLLKKFFCCWWFGEKGEWPKVEEFGNMLLSIWSKHVSFYLY